MWVRLTGGPHPIPAAPLTDGALVHVLVACPAREARGAGADGSAVDGVCVADGVLVAGVADTGIIQVT